MSLLTIFFNKDGKQLRCNQNHDIHAKDLTHALDKILKINETAIHQLYMAEDFHNPIMFIILDLRTTTTTAENPLVDCE